MKMAFIAFGLIAVFFLTTFGGVLGTMVSHGIHPIDTTNWGKEIQNAFDPSWVEKFHKADLPTMLKAVTGTSGK